MPTLRDEAPANPLTEPVTGRPIWRSYCGAHENPQMNPLDEKSIAELLDAAVPVILLEPSRMRRRRVKRTAPR